MIYERTRRFNKSLDSLPANIQEKTFKALTLFVNDPQHPSLQVKKMKKHKGIWEGRVDKFYRFTFEYYRDDANNQMVCSFRNVGRHDILDHSP
jgi:mRNA interferase RelE/StbE